MCIGMHIDMYMGMCTAHKRSRDGRAYKGSARKHSSCCIQCDIGDQLCFEYNVIRVIRVLSKGGKIITERTESINNAAQIILRLYLNTNEF